MKTIRTFCVVALALLVSAAHACAADVAILSSAVAEQKDDPFCNVRLAGPVVAGDYKKLASAIDAVSQRSGNWSGNPLARLTLCLDSPGGSYAEGLQIANLLLERHFSTMIEPNSICYSACALIFMAGGYGFEGRHFSERSLHVTGQLGFHAPYVKGVPQQTYSSVDLETAYKASIRAIRDLIKLGQKHGVTDEFMPKSLIGAMLEKGPDELFLVDNIYKAAKINVLVYGTHKAPITVTGLCNACILFHFRAGTEWSLDEPPGACNISKETIERRGNQTWFGGFGSEGQGYCVAQVPSPHGAPFGVSHNIIYNKSDQPKGDEFFVPYNWYLYPAATKLQNLK